MGEGCVMHWSEVHVRFLSEDLMMKGCMEELYLGEEGVLKGF